MKKQILLSTLFFVVVSSGRAQDSTETRQQSLSFKLGGFYTSRLHYYGRTDSLRSSGFFPIAELGLGKNFYMNAAPVFVINSAVGSRYEGTVATAGFRFLKQGEYLFHVYGVKPFYRDNSALPQSALQWQGAVSYSRFSQWLNVTVAADLKKSAATDWGSSVSLDHVFRKEWNKMVLVVDPTASLHAGTQRFTSTSYRKNGWLIFPGITEQVDEEVKRFTILSYEFSLPVVLAPGSWQLILSPSYVIPQNLVVPANRPELAEQGRSMFYVTAGARYSF